MVIYTVDSLLQQGESAIIGLTSGDYTYNIIDLLCNHKTPVFSAATNAAGSPNTFAYAPEPANLLTQYACLEHIQHGVLQGKAYSEIILSSRASAVEQIKIDVSAKSWEPVQERLLADWLEFVSSGFQDNVPHAYLNHRGEPEALSGVYKKIILSKQNVILTTETSGHLAIMGFYSDGVLYGAKDILTNSNTNNKLKELLGYTPAGYAATENGRLLIYSIAEPIRSHTLCVPADLVQDITDLGSINSEYSRGLDVSECLNDSQTAHFAKFDRVLGEDEAIQQFNSLHNPCIYTIQINEAHLIYAAIIEGVYISLQDICRLQSTYEKIADILGVDEIPCQVGPNLTMSLILTDEMLQAKNVIFRDFSSLELNGGSETARLREDFSMVSSVGLSIEAVTSRITLPVAKEYTLTHFKNLRGDFQDIEHYTAEYNKVNPVLTSEIQSTPTSLLSRALPTYQQLKEIYGIDSQDNEDNEDEPEVEAAATDSTNYFVDELTGTAEADIRLEDYSQLDMNINLRYMPLKTIFNYYDCVHYKNVIATLGLNIDPALIEGNANNNTLPIQENELNFYLGLRNLIIYGICVERDIYTLDELENLLMAGISSTIVDAFLKDLANDAYTLNWTHTGHVLADATDAENDDSEDTDNEAVYKGLPGRYYVTLGVSESGRRQEQVQYEVLDDTDFTSEKGRFANFQPGMPRITAYANLEVKNPFTWVEIAIRLMRWGARKPNSLYVPSLTEAESGPRFLNMQTLITSGFSGTFTSLNKRTYGDEAAPYLVNSAINFDITENWASDLSELNSNLGVHLEDGDSIPCGVALSSTFTDLKDKEQYFYVDMFTLASQISKGQIKVYGVSFNQETGKFICDEDGKTVTDAYGEDVIYIPERSFSSDELQLWSALENLNADPIVYTQSKCAYLVKYLRVMDEKLSSFKINTVSIFDLIKLCATSIRWDCITECEQVLTISNNDERRDRAAQIRAAYQLSSMDEVLTWMIFTEAIRPFLVLAEHMRDKDRTLVNTLQEALTIQAQMDSRSSSARSMQTDVTAQSFEQLLSKCVKYYQFTHTITNEVVCYAGIVDNTPNSKILIWMASEVSQLPEVQFETRPIQTFYNEWIIPILPYYKAAAQTPVGADKTQQTQLKAREQYQAQLKARFIQASPKTFSSVLKVCIDISKQLKAQRGG